jgi:thiamine biosynthesis lipoprotein
MASESHLILVDPPDGAAEQAVAHLRWLESLWSRFLPTSELTRLNANPGRHIRVANETATLVATMREAWRVTGGSYDPSVLAVLVADGYAASFDGSGQTTLLRPNAGRGRGMDGVEVDLVTPSVLVPEGIAIDPGGIGKGLAADLAVELLLRGGSSGALVSLGGDLAMGGRSPDGSGWLVDVEREIDERTAGTDRTERGAAESVCTLAVSRGGVATSSTRTRRWVHAGREHHHLIDPSLRRESTTDLASVTVVASTGWAAEAHATAGILAGSAGVLGYLDRQQLSGLAQTMGGDVLATADLAQVATRVANR